MRSFSPRTLKYANERSQVFLDHTFIAKLKTILYCVIKNSRIRLYDLYNKLLY